MQNRLLVNSLWVSMPRISLFVPDITIRFCRLTNDGGTPGGTRRNHRLTPSSSTRAAEFYFAGPGAYLGSVLLAAISTAFFISSITSRSKYSSLP